MTNKQAGYLALVAAAGVVVVCAVATAAAIGEAFGAGPPYYGRTENMDKWRDPLPLLILSDSVATVLVAVLVRFGWKRVSRRANDA